MMQAACSFRQARETDLPAILAIIDQAKAYLAAQGLDQWQDGYPNEAVMHEDIARQSGFVLEQDGRIAGIATIVFDGEPSYREIHEGAWTTPEPYACIHRIAVDATLRGTGVADALMRAAHAEIRAQGYRSVRIDTHKGNIVMQRMLARNGYTQCGKIYLMIGNERGAPRVALEQYLPQ